MPMKVELHFNICLFTLAFILISAMILGTYKLSKIEVLVCPLSRGILFLGIKIESNSGINIFYKIAFHEPNIT